MQRGFLPLVILLLFLICNMAHVKFGPGQLYDYYYSGGGGAIGRTDFSAFQLADFNDFDSIIYVSPAIEVVLTDAVRWVWRVKTWSVEFDYNPDNPIDSPQTFTSQAADERGIILVPRWFNDDETLSFGAGMVYNNAGQLGLQTDLLGDIALYNLESAGGSVLQFRDADGFGATATEDTYWDYA